MAQLQFDEKAAEPVPGSVSPEGPMPPAQICWFSLLIDRSRSLMFLVMCLQVFQSSFGVWAFPVLGEVTLGVPSLATEHTKKDSIYGLFEQSLETSALWLFFFLHSSLHYRFCDCWGQGLFNSNMMLCSIYSALLHLASLGAAPSCAKIFFCSCLWTPQTIFCPNQPWTTLFSCFLTPSRLSQNNNIVSELLLGWFVAKFAHSLAVTAAGGSPV